MPQITCPTCTNPLSIPQNYAGRSFTCPHCGETVAAPKPQSKTHTVPDSTPPPIKPPAKRRGFLTAPLITGWPSTIVRAGLLSFLALWAFNLTTQRLWDYRVSYIADGTDFGTRLDAFGSDGWEAFSARRATETASNRMGYEIIFKRAKSHWLREVVLLALLSIVVVWLLGVHARKKCPACAEWIRSAAKVCKHCARDVPAP